MNMNSVLLTLASVCVFMFGISLRGVDCKEPSCAVPPSVVVWEDNKDPKTVSVEWGYGNLTCHTVKGCFGYTHVPNDYIEPQLVPIEIQEGTTLRFIPRLHLQEDFPIQPVKVDIGGFQRCNTTEGIPVIPTETNQSFTVPPQFLTVGINYFIVDLADHVIVRCEFGLRLNVTVKQHQCTPDSNITCNGKGYCSTRRGEPNYNCFCCGDFKGEFCETFDSCLNDPCQNNAECVHQDNSKTGFICKCRLGYQGTKCEHRVENLCVLDLCQNNGTCYGNHTHFTCGCLPGFTGSHCEVNINECASAPCKNDGMCVDKINSFRCYCVPGYYGEQCQSEYNECQSNPCMNGGKCIDERDKFECHCPPGYTGKNCTNKINLCRKNPCFNQSACEQKGGMYTCHCQPGFTGSHCEVNTNECESHPCRNGGTCRDHVNGYQCLCQEMHAGPNCQYTLDMFAPFLEGKPRGVSDKQHSYHVRNLYIVAGTLSGAILIVVIILTGCYCRMHESYKKFNLNKLKYRRHQDEPTESTVDVSSVACPRLSIDAIWEATSLSYDTNQLNSPLHQQSLKPRKV